MARDRLTKIELDALGDRVIDLEYEKYRLQNMVHALCVETDIFLGGVLTTSADGYAELIELFRMAYLDIRESNLDVI